jgi:HlyD family secretion protein
LELAASAESAHANLKREGFVSELNYQEKLKERIEREQDSRALKATVRANEAAVAQAKASLSSVSSDLFKQLAQERTQALTQQEHTRAELAKAEHRSKLTEIRAPVDGVVNGLAVRTAGQVVAAGAVLLTIVPDAEELVTEAWLRNDDVGFVSPGMPAKVKLATYPFQKYGWLTGEVTSIGADSEVPESMRNTQGEPLFYKVRIKLAAQALIRDGKSFSAKSGMQAVADIQLGERTLLEYLTSPLKKAVLEAARER